MNPLDIAQLKADIASLRRQNEQTQQEINAGIQSYNRNEEELITYRMMKENNEIMSKLQAKYDKAKPPKDTRSPRFNKKGMSIRDQMMESKRVRSAKRAKEWAQIIRMESHQNRLQMKLNQQNAWISKLDDIAFCDHEPMPEDNSMNEARIQYTKQMKLSKKPPEIDQTWSPLNENEDDGNDHKLSMDIETLKEEIEFLQKENEKEDSDDRMIRKVSMKMERVKEEIKEMQSESSRNMSSEIESRIGKISNRSKSILVSQYNDHETSSNFSDGTIVSEPKKKFDSSSKLSTTSDDNEANKQESTANDGRQWSNSSNSEAGSSSKSSISKSTKTRKEGKLIETKQSAHRAKHKIDDLMNVDIEHKTIINKMWQQLAEKEDIINTEKKLDKYKTMKLKELSQKQQRMKRELMKKDNIIKNYQQYGCAKKDSNEMMDSLIREKKRRVRNKRNMRDSDAIIESSIRAQKYRKEAMKSKRNYNPYNRSYLDKDIDDMADIVNQIRYGPSYNENKRELRKCKALNAKYVKAINDLRRKYAQMSNKLKQNDNLRNAQMKNEQIINDLQSKYDRLLYKKENEQETHSNMKLAEQISKMKEFNKLLRLHQIEMYKTMRQMQKDHGDQVNVIEDIKGVIVTNKVAHKSHEGKRLSEKRRKIYKKAHSVPSIKKGNKHKHKFSASTNDSHVSTAATSTAETSITRKRGKIYQKGESDSKEQLSTSHSANENRSQTASTSTTTTTGKKRQSSTASSAANNRQISATETSNTTSTFQERFDDICTDETKKVNDLIKRANERVIEIDIQSRDMSTNESTPDIYALRTNNFEKKLVKKDNYQALLAKIASVQSNIDTISDMKEYDVVAGNVSIVGRERIYRHVSMLANRNCVEIGKDKFFYQDMLSVLPDTDSETKWTIKNDGVDSSSTSDHLPAQPLKAEQARNEVLLEFEDSYETTEEDAPIIAKRSSSQQSNVNHLMNKLNSLFSNSSGSSSEDAGSRQLQQTGQNKKSVRSNKNVFVNYDDGNGSSNDAEAKEVVEQIRNDNVLVAFSDSHETSVDAQLNDDEKSSFAPNQSADITSKEASNSQILSGPNSQLTANEIQRISSNKTMSTFELSSSNADDPGNKFEINLGRNSSKKASVSEKVSAKISKASLKEKNGHNQSNQPTFTFSKIFSEHNDAMSKNASNKSSSSQREEYVAKISKKPSKKSMTESIHQSVSHKQSKKDSNVIKMNTKTKKEMQTEMDRYVKEQQQLQMRALQFDRLQPQKELRVRQKKNRKGLAKNSTDYKMRKAHEQTMKGLKKKYDKIKRAQRKLQKKRHSKRYQNHEEFMAAKRERSDKRAKEWANVVKMEAEQNRMITKLNEHNAYASEWRDNHLLNDNDSNNMNKIRSFYAKQVEELQNKKQQMMMKTKDDWNKVWKGNEVIDDTSVLMRKRKKKQNKQRLPFGIEITDVKQVTVYNMNKQRVNDQKQLMTDKSIMSNGDYNKLLEMHNVNKLVLDEMKVQLDKYKHENSDFRQIIQELKMNPIARRTLVGIEKKLSVYDKAKNENAKSDIRGEKRQTKHEDQAVIESKLRTLKRTAKGENASKKLSRLSIKKPSKYFTKIMNRIDQVKRQNSVLQKKCTALKNEHDHISEFMKHSVDKSMKNRDDNKHSEEQRYKSMMQDQDFIVYLKNKYGQSVS